MNYTTNYHLPQWEDDDRIMRTDFNQMCADLETGLTENRAATATAQQTADTARTEAAAPPYVIGSYDGQEGAQDITLGFRPSFLIISGEGYSEDNAEPLLLTAIMSLNRDYITGKITETGFQVCTVGGYHPFLNTPGQTYRYIAFR